MKNIVIILPTYNEKDNIVTLIEKIESVCAKLNAYKTTLLVVDDFSPDGTAQLVNKLMKKFKNIQLVSKEKEGLGAAYVYGMRYAITKLKADYLVQMDADWSHDPQLLFAFVKKIENGADFVVGSRYIPGGSIPKNWGLDRKLFSIVGNLWVRFGLGALTPHDWSSGYRMMRSEVMKSVSEGLSKYSGYLFQVAFLHRVKKMNYKIAEVPLVFVDRIHGKSKFPAVEYIQSVSLYVLNNSTFIKYVLVGVVGFTVQTVIFEGLNSVGIFPGLSVIVGSFAAITTNFLGNNLWTFSDKKIMGLKKLLTKFTHFVTTSLGAVVIQGIVVSLAVLMLGNSVRLWAMVFAIVFLVIPYNYFIYNRFIWKTTSHE